jgi:hypothetical protein
MNPSQFDTTDANPNNDSYRELIERPNTAYSDPLSTGNNDNPRFYYQAGVKILVNGSNLTVLNANGTQVSSSSPKKADRDFYAAVAAAITTGQSFQDNREAATIGITTINLSTLQSGLKKITTWNGVLYISDTGASQTGGTPKRGIRLKNGATLPDGGLTLVSDNAVYIQGDYNTAASWQPSAVAGDAVNILSNSWSDANSSASLSGRNASNTTINTAILSGIVSTRTNPNTYSGGVENFPRFLENWSGDTLTYNGSMVQIFNSKQAVGTWGKGNVYDPPNRNWAFDSRLRSTPPPGVFLVTSYVRGRWYME